MKIVHECLSDAIDFDANPVYSLIIENSELFFKLTNELFLECNGEEGGFVLSKNFKMDKFEKQAVFIHDYFNLSCSGIKVDKLIKSVVLEKLNELDNFELMSKINQSIIEINERVIDLIDLDLSFDDEFDYEKLIKISNFKIKEDSILIEKLYSYIDIFVKLKNIKLVILINLFDYFSEKQINELLKQLKYSELYVLLINSHEKYRIENVKQTIIDNDLCEI